VNRTRQRRVTTLLENRRTLLYSVFEVANPGAANGRAATPTTSLQTQTLTTCQYAMLGARAAQQPAIIYEDARFLGVIGDQTNGKASFE
jgi:hypothetical protein